MARYIPICDGVLTINGQAAECVGTWLTNVDASVIPGAFDVGVLDPVLIMNYFGAGFGIVGACAVLGICVGVILRFIRSY
jgi:hypothetical protein